MTACRPLSYGKYSLPVLTGVLFLLSAVYLPLSHGSVLTDVLEIAVPVGIACVLAAYSLWLLRGTYETDQVKRMAVYGWVGAAVASFGSWWFLQHLRRELAVAALFDEALTVVSLGSSIGVFVGTYAIRTQDATRHERGYGGRAERDRLLAETVWTNEPAPDPILSAITKQIAEIEGVDPLELDPMYEYVNPDLFDQLTDHDDSQWQLRLFRDEYEIRVSSHGTVTIYDAGDRSERRGTVISP